MAAEPFRFGEFELRRAPSELRRGTEIVELHARPLQLLIHLVEQRARFVSKQEAVELLWPGTVVSESALFQVIREIREALDDDGVEQRWLRTLRGRGFRFVGELADDPAEAVHPGTRSRVRSAVLGAGLIVAAGVTVAWLLRPSGPQPTSLIVLPFEDLSPAGDHRYLAAGMTEELIDTLSRVEGLGVMGRTTGEFAHRMGWNVPEIGERLGVGSVIEGSVRRSGDRLRITVQLVQSRDGFHIWSQSYDRPLNDVFEVQREIARAVTAALAVRLGPRAALPPTSNVRAYELYLLAAQLRMRRNEAGIHGAIELLERAVALDPGFASAHASLATAHHDLCDIGYQSCESVLPRAHASLARALQLDAHLGLVHKAWAALLARGYDWPAAEREYRRSLELDPNDWETLARFGTLLARTGRIEEGLAALEEALRQDPLSPAVIMRLATALSALTSGLEERIAELWERAAMLVPDMRYVRYNVPISYLALGRREDALRVLLAIEWLPPIESSIRDALTQEGSVALSRIVLGYEVERTGEPCTEFRYWGAAHRLVLGDEAGALECLEKGYREHSLSTSSYLRDGRNWGPLRDEPRFQAILQGMNLAR